MFCPACGYRLQGRENPQKRAIFSLLLLFVGTVFALLIVANLTPVPETDRDHLVEGGLWALALLVVGALGLVPLGASAWSESFPLEAKVRDVGLAIGLGGVAFLMNAAYVSVVNSLLVSEIVAEEELLVEPGFLAALVTIALFPAVVEELLDRGVAWTAVRHVVGVSQTIFATALLFGFLHAFNGAGLLEVPHRFLMGLVLGWLRARTGSLVPCMVAHGLNNLLAVALWA